MNKSQAIKTSKLSKCVNPFFYSEAQCLTHRTVWNHYRLNHLMVRTYNPSRLNSFFKLIEKDTLKLISRLCVNTNTVC